MIRSLDVKRDVKKIIGNSDDSVLFQKLTQAIEILANKGDWDPLLTTLDIGTVGKFVILPPEVETILGLNMCGFPSVARDEFFQFHLNGPGSRGWGWWGGSPYGPEIRYEWCDLNDTCTYRDIPRPDKLIAYCVEPADTNIEFWVEGLDQNQDVIRTQLPSGEWRTGWQVPVFPAVGALPPAAPIFSRITGVRKPITAGPIRLATAGNVLLGIYQPTETSPAYRKIQLSRCVPWIRIRFRRRTVQINSWYDLIPLDSPSALIMMVRALKAYDTAGGLADAEGFEATAVRWASEEQFTHNPPVAAPLQVLNSAPLLDSFDYMQ